MGDWSKPGVGDLYTNVISYIDARLADLALGLSSVATTPTNLPTNAIRWNPTNGYWEIRSAGGTWSALITKYLIDVDKLDGQDGTFYQAWANLTGKPTTFPPSTHNHDTSYYTQTLSDARYASKIVLSGNNILLQTFGGTTLTSFVAPYAALAGDSATVAGYSIGQSLLTSSNVNFNTVTTAAGATVKGTLALGNAGAGASLMNFWDDTGAVFRGLRWDHLTQTFQMMDSTGAYRKVFTAGTPPAWTDITGVPSTFAPAAHGHVFSATYTMQLRGATTVALASLAGLAGELIYDTTTLQLVLMDGSTLGGIRIPRESRLISTGTGLTGGGSLGADRTIALDVATLAEAQAGTSAVKAMTPQRTADAIAALTRAVATLAEAQAGTSNTVDMTPLRVADHIAAKIASQAVAEAGTDNATLMTPLRTAQAIALQTAFQKKYISTQQTITTGGSLTLAHGLGAAPTLLQAWFVCQTADQGYAIGDVLNVSNYGFFSAVVNSTNVLVKLTSTSAEYKVVHKTSGSIATLTVANWKMIIGAFL